METVGDSWLGVGGFAEPAVSEAQRNALVETTARFALAVRDAVSTVPFDSEKSFVKLRIGLHAGSLVTGLTGRLTPRFCIFGDVVNTASRMETTGRPGRVHASEDFSLRLKEIDAPDLVVMRRTDLVDVKGKGLMRTYWIENMTCTVTETETREGELAGDQDNVVISIATSFPGLKRVLSTEKLSDLLHYNI